MSTATGSAQSMRQQLDELDALLQRMLTLPINQLDDAPAQPPPPRPAPPAARPGPQPYAPPRMRLIADSSPVPPPEEKEPVGYERAFALNLNPQQGSSVLGHRSPAVAPPRPAAPEPPPAAVWRADSAGFAAPHVTSPPTGGAIVSIEPLPSTPGPAAVAATGPVSAALRPSPPPRRRTPPTLNPLALVDAGFVAAASAVGAPGAWLAGPAGKNLLGYAGLLMLGGCAAWGVLDWFGWTW